MKFRSFYGEFLFQAADFLRQPVLLYSLFSESIYNLVIGRNNLSFAASPKVAHCFS